MYCSVIQKQFENVVFQGNSFWAKIPSMGKKKKKSKR